MYRVDIKTPIVYNFVKKIEKTHIHFGEKHSIVYKKQAFYEFVFYLVKVYIMSTGTEDVG